MRNNTWKYVLLSIAFFAIVASSFIGGILVGQIFPGINGGIQLLSTPTPVIDSTQPVQITNLDELFKPFWEAWDYVDAHYVEQPVDKTLLMRGAIAGMLESLNDPHTSYMDPEMYRQQSAPLEGEYEGIGAWVDVSGEFLTIISPMPGSPAEIKGLKTDDQVIAVDGEDMTGITGDLVLRKIIGPAGTNVVLTIFRPSSQETFDVEITRQKIEVPSVTSKMLDDNIAYIQLANFGENTHDELRSQLKELLKNDPIGLVLDLRNNGGGYLDSAIQVTSEFVDQSPIMVQEYGNGDRITYDAKPFGIGTKIPLAVLINGGSASASEITAGAIQDYERGVLVGTQSYGKGSVQNWITLLNDEGAIRVTVARWLTPNERQINSIGLTPNYVVELTEENIQKGEDTQLEKAIDLLKGNSK
ncbi:MAG: S41 family peptidase [Chloroflexi bacterium HGW-Chloroflexi-8]|nr:MAG: S41 family peptidase [Chloroflexi bacterium HGW-Chloroflexi-8]